MAILIVNTLMYLKTVSVPKSAAVCDSRGVDRMPWRLKQGEQGQLSIQEEAERCKATVTKDTGANKAEWRCVLSQEKATCAWGSGTRVRHDTGEDVSLYRSPGAIFEI